MHARGSQLDQQQQPQSAGLSFLPQNAPANQGRKAGHTLLVNFSYCGGFAQSPLHSTYSPASATALFHFAVGLGRQAEREAGRGDTLKVVAGTTHAAKQNSHTVAREARANFGTCYAAAGAGGRHETSDAHATEGQLKATIRAMAAVEGNLREPRPFGSSVGEELSTQRDSEPSNGRQQAARAEPSRSAAQLFVCRGSSRSLGREILSCRTERRKRVKSRG